MKSLSRNPLRHEGFALAAEIAKKLGVPLAQAASNKRFQQEVVSKVKLLTKNAAYVYGQRAEALFEMIVASLGSVRLLKHEDSGRVYHSLPVDLRVPDFRLVLKDGKQILVEVKNETDIERHKHHQVYVRALQAYAKEMGCELYFAINWVKWSEWTLVHADALSPVGEDLEISLPRALTRNEMVLLGDRQLATVAPLRFRLDVESNGVRRRGRSGTGQQVMIKEAAIYSDGHLLTDAVEKRIAFALMIYGRWNESKTVETDELGKVQAVNYDYTPPHDGDGSGPPNTPDQELQIIGSLSGMIAAQYAAATTTKGKPTAVLPHFEPGGMRDFVPADFFSLPNRVLPLWVLEMHPDTASEQHLEGGPDTIPAA